MKVDSEMTKEKRTLRDPGHIIDAGTTDALGDEASNRSDIATMIAESCITNFTGQDHVSEKETANHLSSTFAGDLAPGGAIPKRQTAELIDRRAVDVAACAAVPHGRIGCENFSTDNLREGDSLPSCVQPKAVSVLGKRDRTQNTAIPVIAVDESKSRNATNHDTSMASLILQRADRGREHGDDKGAPCGGDSIMSKDGQHGILQRTVADRDDDAGDFTIPDNASNRETNSNIRKVGRNSSGSEQPAVENLIKLKDLKPTTPSPWAFIARVVARNPVRQWKTWQDAGSLLEVFVGDSLHGCTRVTLFNEIAASCHDVVVPGNTCYFAGGRIKRAFASKNAVEVSFGSDADIHLASEPLSITPQIPSLLLADVARLNESTGATATTIAILHALGPLKRIVTKKGKTVEKRELLLVDDSGYKMVCTTWGQLARDSDDIAEGAVLVVKDGILSSYNGLRSASIGVGSTLLHEPALDRADQLRVWYTALAPGHSFTPLAVE